MPEERLQKYLAHCGVASRRASEKLMAAGRVQVDGQVVREMGTRIDPDAVEVRVDGQVISAPKRVYYLVNKPEGVICSNDPVTDHARVVDLVEDPRRLFPVGRLDVNSSGLIIVTNDGDLTYRLTHPKFDVPRTYEVTLTEALGRQTVSRLEEGVRLDDGPTRPCQIRDVRPGPRRSRATVTVFEGRNRLIRRMFQAVGHTVEKLHRVQLGSLKLGPLKSGQARHLTRTELAALWQVGQDPAPDNER